ncbi:DUF4331 domain-containing protein [Spirosoma montaniterrae]|uniref:Secretion system C-terminal sorting domain-containing protein n=1 Tax=Spirosoma montaniterrae TaxID=1178516 RepID=A0A1P9WY00_9BACT|nr:DUF4331 domain-containing protein [Spirosoma montaniterrae]AQG80198.1 hypothetical protein AWR27_13245 [Spirosoma montaniterrae]
MKKLLILLVATVVAALPFSPSVASSHREAPLISNDPLADNTDVYAFKSPVNAERIVLIANYIPFEDPAGGPNWYTFGERIRYEIHVKNRADTPGDDITYRFTFQVTNEDPTTFFNIRLGKQNQRATYTCERSMDGGRTFQTIISNGIVPPANIGPRSIENKTVGLGAPNYNTLATRAIMTASTGERIFCGPVDDPFFVDLGGAFDVGNFRQPGPDAVAKYNCHTIAIEVPVSTLQKDRKNVAQAANILDPDYVIGVWASASRQRIRTFYNEGDVGFDGEYVQVSRLGMPLTNEVVIPIGQKDRWNALTPYNNNDLRFAQYFVNPELALYMDDSQFGGAVPGLAALRIQSRSLGSFDFRNGKPGLFTLKGNAALNGTALAENAFGAVLLPNNASPRAVDLLPIFYTGVPNLAPYQLATGKNGNPLAVGKPFVHNFLPTLGDMLRLNMAVPATPRSAPEFSSLGLVQAAVLGLTDSRYTNPNLQFIPNMDGFPNGRRLEDDVTTIELQAVGGVVLAALGLWYDDFTPGTSPSPVTPQLGNVLGFNAGITKNDTTFKANFPFVQDPWRGFIGNEYTGPNSFVPTSTPHQPARVAALEEEATGLRMRILGNPTTAEEVTIEVRGAAKQALQLSVVNTQGQVVSQIKLNEADEVERRTLKLGTQPGAYLLKAATPTDRHMLRIIRH